MDELFMNRFDCLAACSKFAECDAVRFAINPLEFPFMFRTNCTLLRPIDLEAHVALLEAETDYCFLRNSRGNYFDFSLLRRSKFLQKVPV